ncbi:MAG: hypothetical protein JWN84_728 [Nocardioides sp.]|nr:hypothetical protein [Nocardioides sp.]
MTSSEPVEPLDPVDPVEAVEPVEPVEAGPEEPRRYPSTIGGFFYLAILLAALASIGIIVAGDWRVGVRVLGVCLGGAALLRLVLPQRDAGMLAVRHRVVDVVMLAVVAGVLWWLAGSIPDQPPA